MARCFVDRMDEGSGTEKKAVAGHGVRNARAGENGSVEGGKDGNEDGDGHKDGGGRAEGMGHHVGGDSMAGGDFAGSEDVEVGGVDEEKGCNDQERSADEGAGEITLGIADFGGNHADVIPAVVGP